MASIPKHTRLLSMHCLLLCVCSTFLLLLPLSVTADLYTDPEYTFRIDPAVSPLPTTGWTYSTASTVDDGPADKVAFTNFNFTYWYRTYSSVAIDPNGALELPPPTVGQCCTVNAKCSFLFYPPDPITGTSCSFESAYYDLIALSTTDLDPTQNSPLNPGGIYYNQTSTKFFVKFVNIQIYATPSAYNVTTYGPIPSWNFSAELNSNGIIVTRYQHVTDPVYTGGYSSADDRLTRWWMVGLRQGNPVAKYNLGALNPPSLQTRNIFPWNTTQNGTYPPRSAIQSGTTVTYWPFGSVACNSPSFGDGLSVSYTYIYLKTFRRNLDQFQFECVFNGGVDQTNWPTTVAFYNATMNALLCYVPPLQPPGTVLKINLQHPGSTDMFGFIPITDLYFTYYSSTDPVMTRYNALASRSGNNQYGDKRVCYDCARMMPDLCLAGPSVAANGAICNTPKIGSSNGGTATVVLAPFYNLTARQANNQASNLYCVWNIPGGAASANRKQDLWQLNPFYSDVTWMPAQYYSNVSWIVCNPPQAYSAGTVMYLSLAEDNFVWAGGIGPVGGGYGSPTPLGISAVDLSVYYNTSAQLVLQYTFVTPTDPTLVAYQSQDYISGFLFNPADNLNSTTLATRSTLNLQRYCADCAAVVYRLRSNKTTAASSLTDGFCVDTVALNTYICLSPPFGDSLGAAVAGSNATFNVFLDRYPGHVRRRLFNLSCVMSNYYVQNYSSVVNITVQVTTVKYNNITVTVCVNGTSPTDPPVCSSQIQQRPYNETNSVLVPTTIYTPNYIPLNYYYFPMTFDPNQNLYSCQAPPQSFFPFSSVAAQQGNISMNSVIISLGENNQLLPLQIPAVYSYLNSADPALVAFGQARNAVPTLPAWASCFTCDPSFKRPSSYVPAPFSVTSDSLPYCFAAANILTFQFYTPCNSPPVGDMMTTTNTTIQLYTNAVYPIATRASVSQMYCRWTLTPQYSYSFNSTNNVTTTTLLNNTAGYVYTPVTGFNLDYSFAVCNPPDFSVFGVGNLSLTLTEYSAVLPFPAVTHTYVPDTDPRLVYYRNKRSAIIATNGGSADALTDRIFNAQMFCNDCHNTNVNAPNFTAYSPVGQTGLCYIDCANEWNGGAVYDDCGVCSLGSTSHVPNVELDCLNTCFGPFTAANVTINGFLVPYCSCVGQAACLNISTQPLIGVATTPLVPGHPQSDPISIASPASQQYLLKTFPIPVDNNTGLFSTKNDVLHTNTSDPNFDSSRFNALPSSNWFSTSVTASLTTDPTTIILPFKFPYFENSYSTLYLSSSGALMFLHPSKYPSICVSPPSGQDSRIRNIGFLSSLFNDPEFANQCVNNNLIMPYMTYLDPSGASTVTSNITTQQAAIAAAALAAFGMPTNSSATISYLFGNSSSDASAPVSAQAGAFVSIKFENVPYNWVAVNPWAAGATTTTHANTTSITNATAPLPLYSFQITLYATGRISLKIFNVTDPLVGAAGGFNTTQSLSNLVVGLINRPLPKSALSQSSPPASYIYQTSVVKSFPFQVEGTVAMDLQRQWIPSSRLPIGVFPPRPVPVSGTQLVFCPFSVNACIYPKWGPATGGTLISVNLFNLGVDIGCITTLLNLQCVFGSDAAATPATYDPTTQTMLCYSPPGVTNTTVPFNIMEGNTTFITTNKLFWSWLDFDDPHLLVTEYDDNGNVTRISHITGTNDPFPNATQSSWSYILGMCQACSRHNPTFCQVDCNGDFFGKAFVDDCGNCTAGFTGLTPNFGKDCAGVCFGNGRLQTNPSTNSQQCICTPSAAASCQATALPKLNPTPVPSRQYVYHFKNSLDTDSAQLAPSLLWGGSLPSSAVKVSAPLPLLTALHLPFLFPYYAQQLRTVWISPYGAIFFDQISDACQSNGLSALFSGYSNSTCPYHMIAGSTTEFDITDTRSSISYYTSSDSNGIYSVTVVFTQMYAKSDSSFPHTFQIQLLEGGHFTISYLSVQDPNTVARAAAVVANSNGGTYTVPTSGRITLDTFNNPPGPAFASMAPYWLVGINENWYSTPSIYDPFSSSKPLTRDSVIPFPYTVTSHYTSVAEQKLYLGGTYFPTGTFPSRFQVTTASQYRYCWLETAFCMSPTWGAIEGGTLIRFYGKDWGCLVNSTTGVAVSCCASQLELSCVFGNTIVVPATFNITTHAAECIAPAGLPDSAVQVYLAENGRRIGSMQQFAYLYNVTQAQLDGNVFNTSSYYGTDSASCSGCQAFLPLSLQVNHSFCFRDCWGTLQGTAFYDSCGVCSGGLSGHIADSDRDCHGICFGPFVVETVSDNGDNDPNAEPRCVCDDRVVSVTGRPACAFFPSSDGPIMASETINMREYRWTLIVMAGTGVLAALVKSVIAIFGLLTAAPSPQAAARANAALAAAAGGPAAAPAAGAANGAELAVVIEPAVAAPPPGSSSARHRSVANPGLMGAAMGMEAPPPRQRRTRQEREERRARRAARHAAAAGLSGAAAAALADDD